MAVGGATATAPRHRRTGCVRPRVGRRVRSSGELLGTEQVGDEEDTPIPLLLGESGHAGLLVIGSRGLRGFPALLLGSVGAAVAARAACPVVVVRAAEPGAPIPSDGAVVVGVDGSPTSEAALAFAFDAAAARRVSLLVVHVWRDILDEPAMAPIFAWDQIEEDETEVLLQQLAGWGADYPDVEVVRLVARDLPARVLVEHSA